MISVITGPVKTGKTTQLMQWSQSLKSVGGILTPDVDGKRKLYHIPEGKYFPFETDALNENDDIISVGKFKFLKSAFTKAQQMLVNDSKKTYDFLVIDEIGKLEMKDEGLEPACTMIVQSCKSETCNSHLILVIRDYLLEAAVTKYKLLQTAHQIVRSPDEFSL